MPEEPRLGERPITGGAPPAESHAPAQARTGDHLVHVYESPEEQAAVAAEILAAALGRGERALLVAAYAERERTLAALRARGVDVEAAQGRGALRLRTGGEVFLEGGRFAPERTLRSWDEEAAAARRDGLAGLAVAGDMSWALDDVPGVERLAEYEARVGLRLDALLAICQYDRARFPAETLRAVLRSHPLVVHGGVLLPSPFAVPPEVLLGSEPADRELERLLASMHEHDRALQAVRESERRLRTVVSAVASGIVFKSPRAEILDFNPAAAQILGIVRDPTTGRVEADPRVGSIHEDGSPYPLEEWPVMEAIRTGAPVRDRIMGLVRPGGEIRWVRVNAVPISRPGAPPHAAVVSLVDVTDERRAWREVHRGAEQLRLAMECAGHAYWEREAASGRIVAGTPWTLLGYAEPDLNGSLAAWLELVHPEDRARVDEAFRAHAAGRTPGYREEYRVRARDGSWRWVLAAGRALARDDGGQATRVAGTITDVTDSKRIELQLRTAERLASVGTLAAGVAHEVNNPLAYVTANLAFVSEGLRELAARGPGSPCPEDLRAALQEALDGAGRVKGIVQGLRQFAMPPRSTERAPLDPRREIEAAVSVVRNEIAPRARLRVELPAALPAVVAAEHELSQLVVNLLVNAAQAIPEGRAQEQEVAIAAQVHPGRLVLAVRDTGTGIAPEDLPRIFDPFFTTRPGGTGSGLGLAVSHGIVTALGGTIEVESVPGRGSTFRVTLPVAAAAPAPEAVPAPAPPRRARVLVIDDEPLVARSLARLLGKAHEVTTLSAAAEVLRRARDGETWDVVLCDLMMPGMSGMDLEAELATARPDLLPRILYLTGGAFTERSRAFLAAGRPHLGKPVDAAELRAAVDQVIDRGAALGGG
ncbi:MAG TPA: MEDS domain-containing protein [Anaeromyxobacter sp.]|nr:MEDS domain-containing protein [Anaeromyxobacter sp.]